MKLNETHVRERSGSTHGAHKNSCLSLGLIDVFPAPSCGLSILFGQSRGLTAMCTNSHIHKLSQAVSNDIEAVWRPGFRPSEP